MYLELDNGPAGIDGLAVLDGTVNYPSYPCSGTLTQASVSDSEFVATETITSGPGCLSGTWTFTKVSDTTILGSWVGEGYSATTTLYKQT
jgi:hypothetical protein